jgi:hypothetical protein
VAIAFIVFSYGLFQLYERPVNKYLLGLLLRKQGATLCPSLPLTLSGNVQAGGEAAEVSAT